MSRVWLREAAHQPGQRSSGADGLRLSVKLRNFGIAHRRGGERSDWGRDACTAILMRVKAGRLGNRKLVPTFLGK
jgi:hypothetical protein